MTSAFVDPLAGKNSLSKLETVSSLPSIITWCSSGIGLAAAQSFVREGAYVYITGRRQEELDKAQKLIGKNSRAVQAMSRIWRTLTDSMQPSRLKKELWNGAPLAFF